MRAIRGRQLLEEGVVLNETCCWDDEDDESEAVAESERDTILSVNSIPAMIRKSLPESFVDEINCATPRDDSSQLPTFHGVFKSSEAIPVTEDGGVLKNLLTPGSGPCVSEKDIVDYHYCGYLGGQNEPFTTSFMQRSPVRYRMGKGIGSTLPCRGMEFALGSMRSGETSLFLTSPDYGYGNVGLSSLGLCVPTKAYLLWKVQVFEVILASACDDLLMLTSVAERHKVPFCQLLTAATDEKERGNNYYHRAEYISAKRCYRRSLQLMQSSIPSSEEEEAKLTTICQKILRCLAQTSLKLKRNIDCCRFADEALELDRADFTALRKKLSALINLGEFDNASRCLRRCNELCPDDVSRKKINEEGNRLREERARSQKNTRDLEMAMAKGLFPSSSDRNKKASTTESAAPPPSAESLPAEDLPGISAAFSSVILQELDKLKLKKSGSVPQSLTYQLSDLTPEEVAYIEREAKRRDFTTCKVNMELDRVNLVVQTNVK